MLVQLSRHRTSKSETISLCVCNLNIQTHRLRENHGSYQNLGVKTESVG